VLMLPPSLLPSLCPPPPPRVMLGARLLSRDYDVDRDIRHLELLKIR
jgi:hypothetical protein